MRLLLTLFVLFLSTLVSAQTTEKHYKWTYGGQNLDFMLGFDSSLAKSYRSLPRVRGDYTAYIIEPRQQQLLTFIVGRFRDFAKKHRWSDAQTISMMISFVQSLPYTSDQVTTKHDEYPRYPIETLADNGGDCEDTAILLAALLKTMGYDVVLLQGPQHMAVGVGMSPSTKALGPYKMTFIRSGSRSYAYLETTGDGFQLGEFPKESHSGPQDFVAVPLIEKAIVDLDVKVTGQAEGLAQIKVNIRNAGSSPSRVYCQAWFETRPKSAKNGPTSEVFELQPGASGTLTMPVPIPVGPKQAQLNVEAVDSSRRGSLKLWQSNWVDI